MKAIKWFFDYYFLYLWYGPYRQEDYVFYMLEKWGDKYAEMYIKHPDHDE